MRSTLILLLLASCCPARSPEAPKPAPEPVVVPVPGCPDGRGQIPGWTGTAKPVEGGVFVSTEDWRSLGKRDAAIRESWAIEHLCAEKLRAMARTR